MAVLKSIHRRRRNTCRHQRWIVIDYTRSMFLVTFLVTLLVTHRIGLQCCHVCTKPQEKPLNAFGDYSFPSQSILYTSKMGSRDKVTVWSLTDDSPLPSRSIRYASYSIPSEHRHAIPHKVHLRK